MTTPTLLVVDDEAELLSLLSEYFGQQGFRGAVQGVVAGGMVETATADIRREAVFDGQAADVGQAVVHGHRKRDQLP